MNDGEVLILGYTAREVDLFARQQERLANGHGDPMALETLVNMREVVGHLMPAYVLASVDRMEAYVADHGIERFATEWAQ